MFNTNTHTHKQTVDGCDVVVVVVVALLKPNTIQFAVQLLIQSPTAGFNILSTAPFLCSIERILSVLNIFVVVASLTREARLWCFVFVSALHFIFHFYCFCQLGCLLLSFSIRCERLCAHSQHSIQKK